MFSNKNNKLFLGVAALGLLAGCAVFDKKDTDEESGWFMSQFEKDGCRKANEATIAYSRGDFKKTLELAAEAIKENPRNQQALLVGALASEKLGRYNRARQYYEDLIIINGKETSVLGSSNGTPQPISEIARSRLRMITIKQSELVVENKNGAKVFNISAEAGAAQSKNTISRALQKKPAAKPQKRAEIGSLFTQQEQNIIARFLTLKELAEKDLITKEEFLTRRQANIGGLLPLTSRPPALGIDQPVPSPDLIVERINVLKDAVETRAITPREFSAERDVIIEALLPPSPRTRMKPKAPSKNILGAAKDMRKLEVLYDLNLITSSEKTDETKAIEKYLGINRTKPAAATAEQTAPVKVQVQTQTVAQVPQAAVQSPVTPAEQVPMAEIKSVVSEVLVPQAQAINTIEKAETVEVIQPGVAPQPVTPAPVEEPAPQNIVPNVSSPF